MPLEINKNCFSLHFICRRYFFWWFRSWTSLWVCVSRKSTEHHISKTNEENFTQFRSQMYFGS